MTRTGKCDLAVDTGDPALPVAGSGKLARVRRSRTSKWRAGVLLLVHLVLAGHVTHYLVTHRTVSPVEPSEAMYTLELGQINAGFVFLIVALLATLIFGRVFCGWGCHLVALQDLCGFLMKKLGIRPRPFRSRLLIRVPLGLALYMFVWPSFKRLVLENAAAPFPGFTNHLMTDDFWKTFPGPLFTVLTLLTCGFAAVYLLGAKGFCTYGCPYGGLFGVVGRLAPGNIVVNDACEQCGHCTATCTSNVLVHDEVRRYGQVVDPGCMKCMDCISVCPKGALSYRFSTPALFRRAAPAAPRADRFTLGRGEEWFLLIVCLAGTLVFRGLYDGPPLLLAVALGASTAFVAHKSWHLFSRPNVRLQNLTLKLAGAWRPSGRLFAALAIGWLLFASHSAFAQWHRVRGRQQLERTEAGREEVLSGAFLGRSYSPRHERAASESLRHFTLADRWGLVDVLEIELGLVWGYLLHDEVEAAVTALRTALRLAPERSAYHDHLVQVLSTRGRLDEAVAAQREKMETFAPTAADHFRLAGLYVALERFDEALQHYRSSVALAPEVFESRYNFGGLLRRQGREHEAITELVIAAELNPQDAETQIELGLAYQAVGDREAAVRCLSRAIALAPDSPESRLHLPGVILELERED